MQDSMENFMGVFSDVRWIKGQQYLVTFQTKKLWTTILQMENWIKQIFKLNMLQHQKVLVIKISRVKNENAKLWLSAIIGPGPYFTRLVTFFSINFYLNKQKNVCSKIWLNTFKHDAKKVNERSLWKRCYNSSSVHNNNTNNPLSLQLWDRIFF